MPELIIAAVGLLLFFGAFLKVLYDVHTERDMHKPQHAQRLVDETIAMYEKQFAR